VAEGAEKGTAEEECMTVVDDAKKEVGSDVASKDKVQGETVDQQKDDNDEDDDFEDMSESEE